MDCGLPGSSVQGFCRQEYWSGLSFPSPWDLPNPGIEPGSPALQADSLLAELPGKPLGEYIRLLRYISESLRLAIYFFFLISFFLVFYF